MKNERVKIWFKERFNDCVSSVIVEVKNEYRTISIPGTLIACKDSLCLKDDMGVYYAINRQGIAFI